MSGYGWVGGPTLDPFRARQLPDVGKRFREARQQHERQANLLWLGTLVTTFSDHELQLLNDLGSLCPRDLGLLREAGREVRKSAP